MKHLGRPRGRWKDSSKVDVNDEVVRDECEWSSSFNSDKLCYWRFCYQRAVWWGA